MKKCPVCNRTYTDENLMFCLDDGAALTEVQAETLQFNLRETQLNLEATQPSLRVNYNPTPTLSVSAKQFISLPQATGRITAPKKAKGIIFVVAGLLVLILFGGIGAFFAFRSKNSDNENSSNSNQSKTIIPLGNSNSNNNRKISALTPLPTVSPTSTQMVGSWQTKVTENGIQQEIIYIFNPDGKSKVIFKDSKGRTVGTNYNFWKYSDGTLFETFSDGSKGQGIIKWNGNDEFEITIVNNGVPAYDGLKRLYRRLQ